MAAVVSGAGIYTGYAPPVITNQPLSQTIIAGSNVTFTVLAGGTSPLSYQWQFNGANISTATNANYSLTNLTVSNAGNFTVVVTNISGSVTSSAASLIVMPVGYNQISSPVLSDSQMFLSFVGLARTNYVLERSFTLSPANWIPQVTNLADMNGNLIFSNTPDPTTNNFWRIRSVP